MSEQEQSQERVNQLSSYAQKYNNTINPIPIEEKEIKNLYSKIPLLQYYKKFLLLISKFVFFILL